MKLLSAEQLLASQPLDTLTGASVFGAIPETSILWLLEHGRIRALDEGEYLFAQGQPGNSFHVILKGQISYFKYHKGHYAFIKDYNEGEQIGFMSLIALHDRVGRAVAKRATVALEIDSDLFHSFHSTRPLEFGILMMNLAREMARSLRDTDNILVSRSRGES